MKAVTPPSRREFLQTSALISGGLVIGFVVPGAKRFAVAPPRPGRPFAPNVFLRVGSDDTVTVLLAHSEMGQGIWTALPMLIAEELDADWSTIKVEHADAAPVYAHTAFGIQMTGGSTSTWSEFDRYRQAGATARALLVQAAACNLALLLRKMMGAGTPRALHDVVAGLFLALLRLISTARPDSERSRRIWTAIPHGRRNFARCVLPKAVGRK